MPVVKVQQPSEAATSRGFLSHLAWGPFLVPLFWAGWFRFESTLFWCAHRTLPGGKVPYLWAPSYRLSRTLFSEQETSCSPRLHGRMDMLARNLNMLVSERRAGEYQ